jgi:hypothetical protein
MTGVSDNFMGFPLTPPVTIPGGDATDQDALDGVAVEHFENLRIHAKSFQSAEGGKGFVVPSSQLSWCVWTMIVRW